MSALGADFSAFSTFSACVYFQAFNDTLSRVFLCCHERDSSRNRSTGGSTVGLKHSPRSDQSTNTALDESPTNQRDWAELVIVLDRFCFTFSVTAVVAALMIFFPR